MKKCFLAASLALALTTTACLGPNNYFEGLRDWNQEVSENRWVNEAVFIGLNIIPVYGIVYMADIVIFNSIEWWNGDGAE